MPPRAPSRRLCGIALFAALASAAACAPPASGTTPGVAAVPSSASRADRAADPPCEPPAVEQMLPGEETVTRGIALAALLEGRLDDAIQLSGTVLDTRPTDIAAYAVYSAAHRDAADQIESIVRAAERATPVRATFSPGRTAFHADGTSGTPRPITLDAPKFHALTGAPLSAIRKERGEPSRFQATGSSTLGGLAHSLALVRDDHRIDVFGDTTIVVTVKGTVVRVLDVSQAAATFVPDKNIPSGPTGDPRYLTPRNAIVSGTDLYVVLSTAVDVAMTAGQDAYLVAIDLPSGKVRWVSAPLTANDAGLSVAESTVFAGYVAPGASSKPSTQVTALDRSTGTQVGRFSVPGGATETWLWKGGLSVFTSEGYADVTTTPKVEAPPPDAAKLGVADGRPAPERTRCRMTRVVAALDQRDANAAEREIASLTPDESVMSLAKALRGAARFLAEPPANRKLDLTARPPRRIGSVVPPTPAATAKLSPLKIGKGEIVRGPDPNKPDATSVRMPMVRGPKSPDGPVPDLFGRTPPSQSFGVGDTTYVVYADRYLVTIASGALKHVLDLSPLADAGTGMVAFHHAAYVDGLLVVATGDAAGLAPGLVTAIRPDTGEIAWQSPPLSCTTNFDVLRGRIVCAFGPPGDTSASKKARLVVLRADNGTREADFALPSSPNAVDVADDSIRVRGINDVTTFPVR